MFQNLTEKGCLSWKCRMAAPCGATFLVSPPDWYKLNLIIFLIVNPLVFYLHPFIAGWLLVIEIYLHPGDGA